MDFLLGGYFSGTDTTNVYMKNGEDNTYQFTTNETELYFHFECIEPLITETDNTVDYSIWKQSLENSYIVIANYKIPLYTFLLSFDKPISIEGVFRVADIR